MTPNQLNITVGSDVILNVTLVHEEETLIPALIDNLEANLISGLGKRTALETGLGADYITIAIPWVEGRLSGCYSLEVKGSINGLAWAAIGKGLIRYTNATEAGADSVTVEADAYDVTMEAGYHWTDSPIARVEATIDDQVGTPSVDVSYVMRVLGLDFHNLKGNGITEIDVDESPEDGGENIVTIHYSDGTSKSFVVTNGHRGTEGKEGATGPQGATVHYDAATDIVLDTKKGDSDIMGMTQKAITDEFDYMFGLVTESEAVDVDSLTLQDCSIGASTWYLSGYTHAQRHVAIPVIPGEFVELTAEIDNDTAFYAFLSSSYNPPVSNGSSMPFAEGTERMTVDAGVKQLVTIPEGCAWLALNIVDGGGLSATWTVAKVAPVKPRIDALEVKTESLEDRTDALEIDVAEISHKWKDIDTDVTIQNWYIAGDTKKWRTSTTYQCKWLDISAYVGWQLRIVKNPDGACRYAFLKTVSPSQNADVDFSEGTTLVQVESSDTVTIPSDAVYLYLYAVSEGTDVTPAVAVATKKDEVTPPIKLRVAHWNIGHFSLGTASDTTITHEQYPVMRQKWAEAINGINADFFLCCEYNKNMVNAAGGEPAIEARDAVFSLYPFAYVGSQPSSSKYMMCALFGNKKIDFVREVVYDNTYVAGRYYQTGVIDFGDVSVYVVETHLDWNENQTAEADRAAQIQQLIDDFAEYDYVIIAADWNVNNGSSEYDVLAEAGYSMANHGYLGDFNTYPAGEEPNQPLDNIVCKGFAINGIHVVNDNTLTDHCCVYADFTLIR